MVKATPLLVLGVGPTLVRHVGRQGFAERSAGLAGIVLDPDCKCDLVRCVIARTRACDRPATSRLVRTSKLQPEGPLRETGSACSESRNAAARAANAP